MNSDNQENSKRWLLTAAISYLVLSVMFAAFVIFNTVECVDTKNADGTSECIEDVESKSQPFEALFSLVQVAGIVVVIILLIRHSKQRRELHQSQNQLPQSPQTPVQGQDDKEPK